MSSMQELLDQMKAKKAAQLGGNGKNNAPSEAEVRTSTPYPTSSAATQETSVITSSSMMDKLNSIKDSTPIDYIGETIDSQPRTINLSTEGDIVKNRILRLSEALEKEIPDYAHILHTIHKALSKDDELTHLLTDEEVGVLIQAMKHRKGVVLVEEKKKASGKKPLSKTTLDDIL